MAFDPDKYIAEQTKPPTGGFNPDAYLKAHAPESKPSRLDSIASSLKNGAEQFSNMALLGYAPQIAGASTAAIGLGRDAFEGTLPSTGALSAYYGQGKDDAIETLNRDQAASPISGYAGMAGGAITSPVNALLSPVKLAKGAGWAKRLGSAAANGALFGAVYNPGDTKTSDAFQLEERLKNSALGGLGGAAVDGAVQAATPLAKKGLQTLFAPNLTTEGLGKYLNNRQAINEAPTLATVKDLVDSQVADLNKKVLMQEGSTFNPRMRIKDAQLEELRLRKGLESDWQASLFEAQNEGAGLRSEISNHERDAARAYQESVLEAKQNAMSSAEKLQLAQKEAARAYQDSVLEAKQNSMSASERLRAAQREADLAHQMELQDLKSGFKDTRSSLDQRALADRQALESTPHPRELADAVHQSVGDLRNMVTEGSAKARDILEKSGVEVQTRPIIDALRERRSSMFGNLGPVTSEAKATDQALETLGQTLNKLPAVVKGGDAKKLVQQIDQAAEFNRSQGGFSGEYDQALKALRSGIDEQLKANPDYAAQMQVVSARTKLLDEANNLFGTREKAFSNMGTIAAPNRLPQKEILQRLEMETKNDWSSVIGNYETAQSKLKSFDKTLPGSMEAEQLKQIEAALSAKRMPGYKDTRAKELLSQIDPDIEAQAEAYANSYRQRTLPRTKEEELARYMNENAAEIQAQAEAHAREYQQRSSPRTKEEALSRYLEENASRAKERLDKVDQLVSLLKSPDYRNARITSELEAGNKLDPLRDAQRQLSDIEASLNSTKREADPFRNWTPNSTQNKLLNLSTRSPDRASIETARELERLNAMRPEGTPNYVEAIDNNRTRDMFKKDGTRGSRNAVIWRGLGAATGALLGHSSPEAGYGMTMMLGAGGGVAGGYVDKNGGQIAKRVLDHYLDNPAVYDGVQNRFINWEGARNLNPNRLVSPWLSVEKQEKRK